jgi:hypothetical protein
LQLDFQLQNRSAYLWSVLNEAEDTYFRCDIGVIVMHW